ncbi:MAG: lipoate--protein ligase family protein [Gemmataceae bacterium]
MNLLDLTLASPAANLALDEALLLEAEDAEGPEVLRIWESAVPMVVLGAGGSVAIDVKRAACDAEGVPILRRASGGGTVLLGPGCLGFSLILRTDRAPGLHLIQPSTRYVLDRTLNAIREFALEAAIEGTSDLAVNGRKFSGSAQQRKRSHFLHHGTLLYGFDLALIPRYLNPPERQPEYRRGRGHDEFLMNLTATAAELKRRLAEVWAAEEELRAPPLARAEQVAFEKYERDEWNFRR